MSPRNATEIGQRRHYSFDGKDYPSVTTILKLGTPKEWLGAWAAKVVATEAIGNRGDWARMAEQDGDEAAIVALKRTPWQKRDTAAEHGTNVHETLEAIVTDQWYEESPQSDALLEWLAGYSVKPILSEFQVVNRTDGYAGSGDLIADIGDERWLIDLKTSTVLDHTMRLQLAAYRFAEDVFRDDEVVCSMASLGITKAGVLWVPRSGDHWQFIEVQADAGTYLNFLHVKAVHDWTRSTERTAVGEIVLPQFSGEAA